MNLNKNKKKKSLKTVSQQAVGKVRRWVKSNFMSGKTKETIAARIGECKRCGACCKIVFKCPFYKEKEGRGLCLIYGHHFTQCKLFPIEPKDLIGLEGICHYKFDLEKLKKGKVPLLKKKKTPKEKE